MNLNSNQSKDAMAHRRDGARRFRRFTVSIVRGLNILASLLRRGLKRTEVRAPSASLRLGTFASLR
jgi:hypothetical protein